MMYENMSKSFCFLKNNNKTHTYTHTQQQQQQQQEKPLQHVLMISWSKLICLYSYIFSELIEIITAPNNVIETTWTQ